MSDLRRRNALLVAVWLTVTAIALPPGVWAASQRPFTVEEMVDLSEDIVVGRVVSNAARWQGKLIVTVSTIQVNESLKGRSGNQIEITQLGGTAVHPVIGAPVTMTVSEQAALRPGEEVLLFVHTEQTGARQLVGGAQGKFVVQEEPATGKRKLPVAPKQLSVMRGRDQDTVATENMSLDNMRQRIRAQMERHEQAPGGKK